MVYTRILMDTILPYLQAIKILVSNAFLKGGKGCYEILDRQEVNLTHLIHANYFK
jgi:hypothetical protein